jgi:hypothetical protein
MNARPRLPSTTVSTTHVLPLESDHTSRHPAVSGAARSRQDASQNAGHRGIPVARQFRIRALPRLVLAATFLVGGFCATAAATTKSTSTTSTFYGLARSGLDGTFTASYELRGVPGSKFASAVVTVGQRSLRSDSAWLDQSGEWFYRLVTTTGESIEWELDAGLLTDCERARPSAAWTCTGPASYGWIGGSIGYVLATGAFVPGWTIEGENQSTGKTFVSDGHLCLLSEATTMCLGPSGLLSSWRSVTPSPMVFQWTSVRETSVQFTAPPAEFVLPARPREPFLEVPE